MTLHAAYLLPLKSQESGGKYWVRPKDKSSQPLTADKFFLPVLNLSLKFSEEAETGDGWSISLIDFFSGNRTRQVGILHKKFASEKEAQDWTALPKSDKESFFNKAVGTALRGSEFSTEKARSSLFMGRIDAAMASRLLRDSLAITRTETEPRSINTKKVWFDAHGLAVMSDDDDRDGSTFRRWLLVTALSCAYRLALKEAIYQLADLTVDPKKATADKLEQLLEQWTIFLAAEYFKNPINTETIEPIALYDCLRDQHRIEEMQAELSHQISSLFNLKTLQTTRLLTHHQSIASSRITKWGLCLSVIGIFFGSFDLYLKLTEKDKVILGNKSSGSQQSMPANANEKKIKKPNPQGAANK